MTLGELVKHLKDLTLAHGYDAQVDMLIDWEDGQHQAPVRDVGWDGERVILIYEECVHGKPRGGTS